VSFRVGLTGGIASGKTTVSRLFEALGVPVIDTDQLAREVVAPGEPLLARLAERFGKELIKEDGALNRTALRRIAFADDAARADLEALTHPAILEAMERRAATAVGPYLLLVIPLLMEQGLAGKVDRVLVVDCSEDLQIRRLQARDGSTLDQARAILKAQVPRAARLQAAHDIITNDGNLASVRDRVATLHTQYLDRARQARP
jgi:dephospho-CoA kinase